jgi:hypothetical protein
LLIEPQENRDQAKTFTLALTRKNCYFGSEVRSEIRFPVQAQSPFHFGIPFDALNVPSGAGEMQNFGEGSVNLEVSRIGGLDGRFLQGWKLDINPRQSIA